VTVSPCVKTQTPPQIVTLPLAALDVDGPAQYDVGVALSQQALTQALFHAEQSGALCLEVGHETVSQLDSSLLATVMPSMAAVTHGDAVPLRVAIRPSQAPTVTIGQNSIDPMSGMLQDPLVTLSWQSVGVDAY